MAMLTWPAAMVGSAVAAPNFKFCTARLAMPRDERARGAANLDSIDFFL
jgi:hypothetical protein